MPATSHQGVAARLPHPRSRWFHHRWLPLLLAAHLALAACGGGTPTATGPPAATATTAAPATPAVSTEPTTTTLPSTTPPATGAVVTSTTLPATSTVAPTATTAASPTATASPSTVRAAGPPRPIRLRVPKGQGAAELTEETTLTVPGGFRVEVFAAGMKKVRLMAWSPEGDLVITETVRPDGRVYILPDRDRDGTADETIVFAQGLRNPHGLAFRDGALYVAEEHRVVRFPWQGGRPAAGDPEVIVPDLPVGGHYTRTLDFGPDDKLYLSIGSSCNVCDEADDRRAAIVQYNADGSNGRLYATGLRNAVGFTWRPGTDELWATNNGRDGLGDDTPPETINLVRDGQDFGWPYCHNGAIRDQQFGRLGSCADAAKPAVEMQAHSAPLGLAFYTGDTFPADLRGDLLVAFHGSWNRSVPTGYKVVRVRFRDGRPTGQVEDFITGWLPPGQSTAWGRPVDLLVAPDGSLYLSDDALGVVYRITYRS